ncbi:hypothetical protein HG530_011821 [Fusarium avenaceum]|nr:hypothetical protein HG530_011821 [Fusarium avenaceum]
MTFCSFVSLIPSERSHIFTYSHHGTGRVTSDKDPLGVTAVLLENKLDHVGNRVAASTTVVGQGHLGRNIPAVTGGVRCLGVDDDEAVLLGVGSPLVALEVGLGGTSAVVKTNNHSRVGLQVLRHVQEHAGACWVASIVGDLLEGGSGDDLSSKDRAEEGKNPKADNGC